MSRWNRALVFAVVVPAAVAGAAPTLAGAGRVVHSATGAGHVTTAGELRSFSFSALLFEDGSATGEVQVNSRSLDTVVHLRIDCLAVDGATAHMSGVVTRSSNPAEAPVGDRRRFVVRDNGEGGAGPDEISTIPRNPAGETCENSTLVPTRLVENGNVQVR